MPFRRRAACALGATLAPLSFLLIAAAAPPHPPVPKAKPPAPAEEKAVPAPNPKEESVPVPEKRPPPPAKEAPPVSKPATEESEGKPEATAPEQKQEKPATANAEEQEEELPPVPGVPEDGAVLAACYLALDSLGIVYAKESTINDPGRCGMEAPISVTRILPNVKLTPAGKMRCKTALALARWAKGVVEPAAAELGHETGKAIRLTGLAQGSAYVCRLRNNADHGKISQHAFGNAVDIVTFDFAGHKPIAIEPRERTGKIEEGFQRAVIGGACLYFTTVLGPHADAAHQDNLHLDVMERKSGFRLCE